MVYNEIFFTIQVRICFSYFHLFVKLVITRSTKI